MLIGWFRAYGLGKVFEEPSVGVVLCCVLCVVCCVLAHADWMLVLIGWPC